jgi:hypothetical protein
VTVRKEGHKNLAFKRQLFNLVVESKLGTPFSSEKGTLKGNVTFPLYWPGNEAADKFISELAKERLERHPEIAPDKETIRELASPAPPKPKRK